MKKFVALLVLVGAFAWQSGSVMADDNIDAIVKKVAEGDVTAVCQGGRSTITEAAKEAVKTLASSGAIKGDYAAMGKEAGKAFYTEYCS